MRQESYNILGKNKAILSAPETLTSISGIDCLRLN